MDSRAGRWAFGLLTLAISVSLTAVFFTPMWQNLGLVGGDIVTYFIPQKTFLAESLAAGDLPLWNPTVALGYPFVADSQIALWYPTTIPLHWVFTGETALHVNVLLHYVWAFVGTVLFARRLDVPPAGSLLTALAFTYGWFPPRLTVEWAVTTGSYLPWCVWAVESYLRTGRSRWLVTLTILTSFQLLAGHFSLAFITGLTIVSWTAVRCTYARRSDDAPLPVTRTVCSVIAAMVIAFPMAACQLMPTWELRQQSERSGLPIPDVDYGRVPWQMLRQLVWPPAAWSGDVNRYGGADTNPPAASLYVGAVTTLLASFALVRGRDRRDRVWWLLIPLAIVLAVGWLTGVYKYLPGFGYFKIPGRYGIVAALGVAMLAGRAVGLLAGFRTECFADSSQSGKSLRDGSHSQATLIAFAAAIFVGGDLYVHSSDGPWFTEFVPIHSQDLIDQSDLDTRLYGGDGPPRVHCIGQNALAALGVNVVPGFLGLPPEAYADPNTWTEPGLEPAGPAAAQLAKLRWYGVTHLFFDSPPDFDAWECEPAGVVTTPFLMGALNRLDPATRRFRPFYVGRLLGTAGRVSMDTGAAASVTSYAADQVTIIAVGPGVLTLADLNYPGWSVTVDGVPGASLGDSVLRRVRLSEGEHRVVWSYRPGSVFWGWVVSLVTVGSVAGGLGWLRYNATRVTCRSKDSET